MKQSNFFHVLTFDPTIPCLPQLVLNSFSSLVYPKERLMLQIQFEVLNGTTAHLRNINITRNWLAQNPVSKRLNCIFRGHSHSCSFHIPGLLV